jgi:hypothetical protein
MRHSLLLLLGFPALVAAFTLSTSRQRSTAQHQARLPGRRSESGAKRDFNAIRRDPNRFANPNAASELRPFKLFTFWVLSASVAEFHVNGTKIPLVDFDVGDSWAGLLPISSHANETREVCSSAYIPYTKRFLIPASFSFGIFLRLRMVAKTTLFFGEHPPITVRVGANSDRSPLPGRTADRVARP